jgi:hypothetical protein
VNDPQNGDSPCFNAIEDQVVAEWPPPDAEMLVSLHEWKRAGRTTKLPNASPYLSNKGTRSGFVVSGNILFNET